MSQRIFGSPFSLVIFSPRDAMPPPAFLVACDHFAPP